MTEITKLRIKVWTLFDQLNIEITNEQWGEALKLAKELDGLLKKLKNFKVKK